jgi:hypothetical protein
MRATYSLSLTMRAAPLVTPGICSLSLTTRVFYIPSDICCLSPTINAPKCSIWKPNILCGPRSGEPPYIFCLVIHRAGSYCVCFLSGNSRELMCIQSGDPRGCFASSLVAVVYPVWLSPGSCCACGWVTPGAVVYSVW